MNNFKISEIRAALSRLQLQIKEAADIKNTELSYQTDKMEKIKTKDRQRETSRGTPQNVC